MKPIPGFDGYFADENGSIFSLRKRGKTGPVSNGSLVQLSPYKHKKSNHLRISLPVDGKRKGVFVHHLVLLAFVGPCPKGCIGKHKNDISDDNRPSNLVWGTHQSNMKDWRENYQVLKEFYKFVKRRSPELIAQFERLVISESRNDSIPVCPGGARSASRPGRWPEPWDGGSTSDRPPRVFCQPSPG